MFTCPFAVGVVNHELLLKCPLYPGCALVVSDGAELPRMAHLSAGSEQSVCCHLYSPNCVRDDFIEIFWEAELMIDGATYRLGHIGDRCDVISTEFCVPISVRTVKLRLHRMISGIGPSKASEALLRRVVGMMEDSEYNPRGGSRLLQSVAIDVQQRFPDHFESVVAGEYSGSFRDFVAAHPGALSLFHYGENSIQARKLPLLARGERVIVNHEARTFSSPMLPPGHPTERVIIELVRNALEQSDSSEHELLWSLSMNDVFRLGMSSAFSLTMQFFQRHRDIFRWSTDPDNVCQFGLNTHAPQQPDTSDDS